MNTTVYICADGTLTYGPLGGLDKIVKQALPIAVVADPAEAETLITLTGRRAYDVPEADSRFEAQLNGRTIQPGYGPDRRYYYSGTEWKTNDVTTLSAVREAVAELLERISKPDILRPVGTDTDGNGIWTDGLDAWNSGEPLTPEEVAEAEASTHP